MGFRFQKRIKILPGVRVNLSKSGVSTSIGGRGATVNVRKGKVKSTVGIPGTGVSYSVEHGSNKSRRAASHSSSERPSETAEAGRPASAFVSGLLAGLGPLGVVGLVIVFAVIGVIVFR